MMSSQPAARASSALAGVEVVPLDYSECQHNGGGIHCSTFPLVRERS